MWAYVLGGALLAIAGVAVAVWAMRGWLQQTERAAGAEARVLALRNQDAELEAALARAAELESQWRAFVDMLTAAGVLRKVANPLAVTADDLAYEVAAVAAGVPAVEGIAPELMQQTLEAMAERAFSDTPGARRPMARPYLVAPGKLSRNQFDRLRDALLAGGYLERSGGSGASPVLTERGTAMLAAIRDGRLVIR